MSWAGPEEIFLSTSLASFLDKKLIVLLRDGRKLLGTLCSFDQFANVVLQGACERVIVGELYCDVPLGLYVIRGENVVLIGELDREKDELPAHMTCVSEAEIRRASASTDKLFFERSNIFLAFFSLFSLFLGHCSCSWGYNSVFFMLHITFTCLSWQFFFCDFELSILIFIWLRNVVALQFIHNSPPEKLLNYNAFLVPGMNVGQGNRLWLRNVVALQFIHKSPPEKLLNYNAILVPRMNVGQGNRLWLRNVVALQFIHKSPPEKLLNYNAILVPRMNVSQGNRLNHHLKNKRK